MDKGKYKHCLSSSEPASAVADWTRAGHLTQAHQSGPQRLWNWLQGPEPALKPKRPLAACEQTSEESEAWWTCEENQGVREKMLVAFSIRVPRLLHLLLFTAHSEG